MISIAESTVGAAIAASKSTSKVDQQLSAPPVSLLRSVLLKFDAKHYEELAAVVIYPSKSITQPAIVHRKRATAFEAWIPEADSPVV